MTPEDQARLAEIRDLVNHTSGAWRLGTTAVRFLLRLLDAATAGKPAGEMGDLVFGHLSHAEMASKVRMLMRKDLDHEAVCTGARDRILWLANALDAATAAKPAGMTPKGLETAISQAIAAGTAEWRRRAEAAERRVAEQNTTIGNLTTAYEESRTETVAAEAEVATLRTALTAAEGARDAAEKIFRRVLNCGLDEGSGTPGEFGMLAPPTRKERQASDITMAINEWLRPAATQPAAPACGAVAERRPEPIGEDGAKEAADADGS